jgi:hypothetical protein
MAYLCKDRTPNLNILVVDGSPSRDEILADGLRSLGVEYLLLRGYDPLHRIEYK